MSEPTYTIAVQRTFALIKSGAVERSAAGSIMQAAEDFGLQVVEMRLLHPMRLEQAETLYAEHKGRPYYGGLVASVTGPMGTYAMVLEGMDAVATWRRLMGATDPARAEPNTLRARFGRALPDNAVHGSDSPEAAVREAAIFFAPSPLELLAAR